jgi:hypothetical protein
MAHMLSTKTECYAACLLYSGKPTKSPVNIITPGTARTGPARSNHGHVVQDRSF